MSLVVYHNISTHLYTSYIYIYIIYIYIYIYIHKDFQSGDLGIDREYFIVVSLYGGG